MELEMKWVQGDINQGILLLSQNEQVRFVISVYLLYASVKLLNEF
jgi:hypothetical protein